MLKVIQFLKNPETIILTALALLFSVTGFPNLVTKSGQSQINLILASYGKSFALKDGLTEENNLSIANREMMTDGEILMSDALKLRCRL
jgi:hypothetical protein